MKIAEYYAKILKKCSCEEQIKSVINELNLVCVNTFKTEKVKSTVWYFSDDSALMLNPYIVNKIFYPNFKIQIKKENDWEFY